MKTIFKYIMPVSDSPHLAMHSDMEILSVQSQRDEICIWALVDPKSPVAGFDFRIVGTGHPFEDFESYDYVSTVQTNGGHFVWHVFIRKEGQ